MICIVFPVSTAQTASRRFDLEVLTVNLNHGNWEIFSKPSTCPYGCRNKFGVTIISVLAGSLTEDPELLADPDDQNVYPARGAGFFSRNAAGTEIRRNNNSVVAGSLVEDPALEILRERNRELIIIVASRVSVLLYRKSFKNF